MSNTEVAMAERLVDVENLTVKVVGREGPPILDSVAITVEPGKMTALVGESGAGKSMTTKAILGVLDDRMFKVSGHIEVCGEDVGVMNTRARRRYISRVAALVFQNPTRALNPTMRIGPQIAEAARFSGNGAHLSEKAAHAQAIELMKQVGIAAPEERYFAFPHQMSGGMKQRAVIAIALSLNPQVLFCDEPTSSLDVTTQALIMDLLDELRARLGLGILFITHDLVLAASRADTVQVLHAGRVVEKMPVDELFKQASMPYTRDLIARVPGFASEEKRPKQLPVEVISRGHACSYVGECAFRQQICGSQVPPLTEIEPDHFARCWFPVGHTPLDQEAALATADQGGTSIG
jgi:oligopeptide/dipeptide ABC transporter ATP-binding protein